ncbi:MAG: riboflavin synthase [Candidatus Cloacimonetes bacterium]|nr:riboflavin synthase [Candidatus Cloacimonadota bacterium]
MFTGLIKELGTFICFNRQSGTDTITIRCDRILEKLDYGSSVAVNGVCLTVCRILQDRFEADLLPSTLKATALNSLNYRDLLNLEPAITPGSPLGGHFVTGHVDRTIALLKRKKSGRTEIFSFQIPENFHKFLILRGSVALNGVSLTVSDLDRNTFSVSLIPETLSTTNLSSLHPGDQVNMETDIIGKYVNSVIEDQREHFQNVKPSKITYQSLRLNGFIK